MIRAPKHLKDIMKASRALSYQAAEPKSGWWLQSCINVIVQLLIKN